MTHRHWKKKMYKKKKYFLKIFNGEFVKDSGVVYLKEKSFKIECLDTEHSQFQTTTIDGEKGPDMPLNISV